MKYSSKIRITPEVVHEYQKAKLEHRGDSIQAVYQIFDSIASEGEAKTKADRLDKASLLVTNPELISLRSKELILKAMKTLEALMESDDDKVALGASKYVVDVNIKVALKNDTQPIHPPKTSVRKPITAQEIITNQDKSNG